MTRKLARLVLLAFIPACASTALEKPGETVEPHQEATLTPPPEPPRAAQGPDDSASPADSQDAPISRSVGEAGGFVVLYPRIALSRSSAGRPDSELRAIAKQLQQRLAEIAKRARPNAKLDVRPEPDTVLSEVVARRRRSARC